MNILCIKKVLCDNILWVLGYRHKNTILSANQYPTESYLAKLELV